MTSKKTNINTYVSYFFLAFVATAGLSYMNYLPSLVNALAGELGFTSVQAGQIVAINGYGGLLGIAMAILLVTKINQRSTIILALLILTLTDLASAWIDNYELMLGWRFFAGTLGGLCVGLAFSSIARTKNPDRGFGFLLLTQFSVGSLVILLLPGLEFLFGSEAVFCVMAGITLTSIAFQLLLPDTVSTDPHGLHNEAKPKLAGAQLVLILSITLYQVAASAIWAYAGLIGLEANLGSDNVSDYLGTTSLLGLLGAMLPILKRDNVGRLKWILTGITLSTVSAALLLVAEINILYVFSMAFLFISWPIVLSFLLAITADQDESGRLSTMAALVSYFGLATGPLLAASIFSISDVSTVLLSCALIFLISCILLLKPAMSRERVRKNVLSL